MASGRAQGYTKLALTWAGDTRMVSTMPTLLKPISIWVLMGVVTLAVSSTIAGQGQAPPRARAEGAPLVPHHLRQNRRQDIRLASW